MTFPAKNDLVTMNDFVILTPNYLMTMNEYGT
jgi:hypothetical protein